MLKSPLLVLVLIGLNAVEGQQPPEVKEKGDDPDVLVSAFRGLQARARNSEQWFLKTIDEVVNLGKRGSEGKKNLFADKEALGKFFQNLIPRLPRGQVDKSAASSSTPASTTTAAPSSTTTSEPSSTADPMRQINRSLQEIGTVLGSSSVKLLETPMKVFSGLLTTGTNLTRAGAQSLDQATGSLVSQVNFVSKPAVRKKGERGREEQLRAEQMEDDLQYYEFARPDEPYAYRRPKYFSRECPFRFACEVGKLMKPLAYSVSKKLESDRFIQDLQNRYTRAMTYGSVRGDCERYYCVLVKMLGGPAGFAAGVAEMVNRVVNSDLYSDYDSDNQRRSHRRSSRRFRLPSLSPAYEEEN